MERKKKFARVLDIYTKLMNGDVIEKEALSLEYGVDERSIQRDIDDIRSFLESAHGMAGTKDSVVYDRKEHGYRLEKIAERRLTNSEVLAVCKILLDSRAFAKKEMKEILHKLIDCCVPKSNRKLVSDLIRNEEFHYVELRHKRSFNDTIWEIGKAVHGFHCIEIEYRKLKGKEMVRRKLQPLAVMFSEYYFYLVAFIDDKKLREDLGILEGAFPAIYRIDRIQSLRVLDETFQIPYQNRFEEGEFRKRIQFMYGGRLQKVVFRYQGTSIEAVLDRLPTAEILSEEDGIYTVSAEVYGDGIDMWLHSQMDALEVVKPESLREKMKHSLQEMLKHYE